MTPNERMFRHEHAHKLDDPERQTWLPAAAVIARLGLGPGMRVADIGAGTGYFALPIAASVQPGGHVFAVDAQPEMLELLRARVAGLPITLVHGTADHTTLPDASVDLVLLANVWHEIDDTAAALAEARRIVRPGGRLAILDWRTDVEQPPGPPLDHRVSAAEASASLRSAGWASSGPEAVGTFSYLVVATAEPF
jgi:ubiquinone/menaquinone biosynthesis C-methylase UbiE